MVFIYFDEKLKTFESDIRDLCMAFFPYQKFSFVYGNEVETNADDIVVRGFIKKETYDKVVEIDSKYNILGKFNQKETLSDSVSDSVLNQKSDKLYRDKRREVKGFIKRDLYDYLSGKTNKKLAWGTLTGIRPVTMVTSLIEDNGITDDKELLKFMNDNFYLKGKKAKEILEIAKVELEILNRPENKNYKDRYSIYIGIPFCKSTCLYCSFTSYNIDKFDAQVKLYLDKIEWELKMLLEKEQKKSNVNKLNPLTLYIGGGTPTSLSKDDFARLLDIVEKYVDTKHLVEWTVEAGRPDTIDIGKLKIMRAHKVTRISINPQTFNQKTLDTIGRRHTVEDVIKKYRIARDLGFDNINMDIILGLPDEHILEVIRTLKYILHLKPDSLTVHSLALKRAARLNYEFSDITKNHYLAGLNNIKEMNLMFDMSVFATKMLKLRPYYLYRQKNMAGNLENVGYTTVGKECVYNIMMMSERHTVYGIGMSTTKKVTYDGDNKIVEGIEGYKSLVDYLKDETK